MRKSLTSPTTLTASNGNREFPPICAHCGAPATDDAPVLPCAVNGEEYLLHCECRDDWLNDQGGQS